MRMGKTKSEGEKKDLENMKVKEAKRQQQVKWKQ